MQSSTLHRAAPVGLLAFVLVFLSGAVNGEPVRTLSCADTPFGDAFLLSADREPAMTMLGWQGPGAPITHVSFEPGSVDFFSDTAFESRISSLADLVTVALDFNGDGKDELVYAGITTSGGVIIAIANQTGRVYDSWAINVTTASEIQLVAADLRGLMNGMRDIVIAYRLGNDVHVLGLLGSTNGLLLQDGFWNMRYSRTDTMPQKIALASGDFLLNRGDQVALVIEGRPGGQSRTLVDIVEYRPGNNTFGFSSFGYQSNKAPLAAPGTQLALKATALRWIPGSGMQLAIAGQKDDGNGNAPMDYRFMDFTLREPPDVVSTDVLFTDVLPLIQSFPLDMGDFVKTRFDITASDLDRDGRDELLFAYAQKSSIGGVRVRAIRYQPSPLPVIQLARYGDFGYQSANAQNASDIAVAAGDIDGDGYPEVFTAITFNSGENEMRRFRVAPVSAEAMGTGCASSSTIGAADCPRTRFAPAPDARDTPISGRGLSLGAFAGDDAVGTWTLCMGDSAGADIGSLTSWTLYINNEESTFTSIATTPPSDPITDASGDFSVCQDIFIDPVDWPGLKVRHLEVGLSATHTFVGDLTVELTGPRGKRLTLMNRPSTSSSARQPANLQAAFPLRFSDAAATDAVAETYFARSPLASVYTQVALAMPDWDGNSVFAKATPLCRTVVETSLTSLVFTPPFFRAVQGAGDFGAPQGEALAEIGVETTQGDVAEKTVRAYAASETTMYLGAAIGGEFAGFGMEVSGRLTSAVNYESSTGSTEFFQTSNAFSSFDSATGPKSGISQSRKRTYDCFHYEVRQKGELRDDSFARLCEFREELEGAFAVSDWNEDVPTPTIGSTPASWTPITRDWASLTLDGHATASSGVAGRAIDGLLKAAPVTTVTSQAGAFWLVDMGAERDVHSVRLHMTPGSLASLAGQRVFLYRSPRATGVVPSGADVSSHVIPDVPIPMVTLSTLSRVAGVVTPTRARFIRISAPTTGGIAGFSLTEVQAFGASRLEPGDYPVAVCDPVNRDGFFSVKKFVRGSVNAFRWIDVFGDAEWLPTLGECPVGQSDPEVPKLAIMASRTMVGGGNTSWSMASESTTEIRNNSGTTNSSRAGSELAVEAGGIVKIQAGGGYEATTGVSREESSGSFWSKSLIIAGAVPAIPAVLPECDYAPRPYQYVTSFRSNSGFEHRVMVVDYIINLRAWSYPAGPPTVCSAPSTTTPTTPLVFRNGFESGAVSLQHKSGQSRSSLP